MAYPSLNETLRGRTSGVFVVLLVITAMPKGLGNLLAVLVGAASYLVFLMLQPSEESPVEEVCPKGASGRAAGTPEDTASSDDDDDGASENREDDRSGASGRADQVEEEAPGSAEPPQLDETLQGELAKLKKPRNVRKNRARFQALLRELMPFGAEAAPAPAAPEVHEAAHATAREKDVLVQQQAAATGTAGPYQQLAPSQGVHSMEARLAGDAGGVALAAFPVAAPPPGSAQGPAQMCGFPLAGLGQPVCMPFAPLRADPPLARPMHAQRPKPRTPTAEQLNWEECWSWVSRGWCPKGPACKWAHPRDKDDTGPNFYYAMKLPADSDRVPTAACRDKDCASGGGADTLDSTDTPNEASADTSDPDAFLTDDGF